MGRACAETGMGTPGHCRAAPSQSWHGSARPRRGWPGAMVRPGRKRRFQGGAGLGYEGHMAADAHTASQCYGSVRGSVACRLLRERLVEVWPDLARLSVLGLGYTA